MLKTSLLALSLFSLLSMAQAQDDMPQAPLKVNATLLAEVTAQGQKVNAVALEYEDNVLSGSDLRQIYQISTALDNKEKESRSVLNAYVNDAAEITSTPKAGRFVIIELDTQDKNADLYSVKTENDKPMQFRAKDKDGKVINIEKTQNIKVPEYYQDRLVYQIAQTGYLKLTNGKTLDKSQVTQHATKDHVKTSFIDDFKAQKVFLHDHNNILNYRVYIPKLKQSKKYPLTIFLHGSGQVGTDNMAHIVANKGAISTLQYEPGFVLAPQYGSVFDPFDDVNKGHKGGIHWQTDNRQELVLKMIDDTLKANAQIDRHRIYLVGLSRGAEGALQLLLKRPQFFAGAILASGREAYTIEWMNGNANKTNLAAIKDVPIWFFHSKEDKVSPVQGSRINYQILTQELQASHMKYTEFTMQSAGDNGIVNASAHNTWDAVFNSPEVMKWLLNQKLTK
ncbi:alpha/beta hydrolase-fold protein [Pasteurella bettyae]|uniref:Phospholipase/carboxylesterase n=1 Tax=Pasteurella bettyae CCUG 2042 TaxID=1095749 RepID=I3DGR9_9PAST|nr:alpha/beta hydrolase-fold protein [Pasteurella bettyae]EIJ70912.1 phospholipase/carboxylesterase [Pasteurella bettyae CCUG 2042]SUB22670.1 Poly(3-hydroxybutyrate) depolymerase [Pasteurella bettyae]